MTTMKRKKYILDVDTGVDDAAAIILAVSSIEDIDVLAITCVSGNCPVDQACLNTLRVLQACKRLDIPVYRGSSQSLLGTTLRALYHAEDGLGNVPNPAAPGLHLIQPEHASNAIVHFTNKFPGEVTLVTLGPLTNVAVAMSLDPDLGTKLMRLAIMGGNCSGRGNVKIAAEFNFASDPEAAYVALNRIQCPIWIIPWETVMRDGLPLKFMDELRCLPHKKAKFFTKITSDSEQSSRHKGYSFVQTCDGITMATLLDQSVVTDLCKLYCTVELTGLMTRGQMVLDWQESLQKTPNANIVLDVDMDKVCGLYKSAMIQESSCSANMENGMFGGEKMKDAKYLFRCFAPMLASPRVFEHQVSWTIEDEDKD